MKKSVSVWGPTTLGATKSSFTLALRCRQAGRQAGRAGQQKQRLADPQSAANPGPPAQTCHSACRTWLPAHLQRDALDGQ